MFEISTRIIDRARPFCSKKGRCLQGNLKGGCKPIKFDGMYLVVEPKELSKKGYGLCLNCIKVEDYYVCLCAIRKEIFRKYNQ
jgi:hypothetical protein